jgi:amino acid permease
MATEYESKFRIYRLIAAFGLSVIILIGSFVIILAPTNQSTTNAAVAFVSSVITAWATYLVRGTNTT